MSINFSCSYVKCFLLPDCELCLNYVGEDLLDLCIPVIYREEDGARIFRIRKVWAEGMDFWRSVM